MSAPESPSSIAATLRPLAERAREHALWASKAARASGERGSLADWFPASAFLAEGMAPEYAACIAACSPERVLALCEAVERGERTLAIANAAVELVAESRAALRLGAGAALSEAVAALATFMREWDALDTDLGGPYDDASYRAIGEALNTALHRLRAPTPEPTDAR